MRRLVLFAIVGALVLSACRRSGDLSPENVLRRATQTSRQLQSVEYDADIEATLPVGAGTVSGSAMLHGILAHGGEQASFSASVQGILEDGADRWTITGDGDVMRDPEHMSFLLRTASTEPQTAAAQSLQALLGSWWTIPIDGRSASLTPDPAFLRAQSAVVTVIDDRGLEDIGGRDAYHYIVSIDTDRLTGVMRDLAEERGEPFSMDETRRALEGYEARGELWIDAVSFVIHRITWTVDAIDAPATHLALRMDLRNHNAADPIALSSQSRPLDPDTVRPLLLALSGALRFPF